MQKKERGLRREMPMPAAVAILLAVAAIILAGGWYMVNREPRPAGGAKMTVGSDANSRIPGYGAERGESGQETTAPAERAYRSAPPP
jgi:hypothetical protein